MDAYISPFAQTIRRLKYVSLATCALSIASTPFLYVGASAPHPKTLGSDTSATKTVPKEKSLITKLSVIGMVLATGIGSTALITRAFRSYVLKMRLTPSSAVSRSPVSKCAIDRATPKFYISVSDVRKAYLKYGQDLKRQIMVEFDTLDVLGRVKTTWVPLSSLYPVSPNTGLRLATWQVMSPECSTVDQSVPVITVNNNHKNSENHQYFFVHWDETNRQEEEDVKWFMKFVADKLPTEDQFEDSDDNDTAPAIKVSAQK